MAATATRADVALSLLVALRGADSGLAIDDYEHSLQAATRAERGGAEPDLVLAALLHDVGKAVALRHHDRIAGDLLAGAVRPEVAWAVSVHQDLTSAVFRNGRGVVRRYRHVVNPRYAVLKRFVEEWDLPARDPAYDTLPLEHFEPLVRELLHGRPPGPPRRVLTAWRWTLGRLPEPLADTLHRSTTGLRRRLR